MNLQNRGLGLDYETVQWELDFSISFAEAYSIRAKESLQKEDLVDVQASHLVAATNYRLAGANSLLLGNTVDAKGFFS